MSDAKDKSSDGDFNNAAIIYEKAEKLAPNYWLIPMSRGVCLLQSGKKQEGIQALEKSLKLDPDNERIKRNLKAAKNY